MIGVVLQAASSNLAVMVTGRLIAGLGVEFVFAIIILYMSEIAPRKVRGAIVSGYTSPFSRRRGVHVRKTSSPLT
jgi:MFS family permease